MMPDCDNCRWADTCLYVGPKKSPCPEEREKAKEKAKAEAQA